MSVPTFNAGKKEQLGLFATSAPTSAPVPPQAQPGAPEPRELTDRERRQNAAGAQADEAHRAWCLATNSGKPKAELERLWHDVEVTWLGAVAERIPALAGYELSTSLSRVVINGMPLEELLRSVASAVSVAGAEYPFDSPECAVHVFVSDALKKFADEKMPAVRARYAPESEAK